jgi:hypothetical protein
MLAASPEDMGIIAVLLPAEKKMQKVLLIEFGFIIH